MNAMPQLSSFEPSSRLVCDATPEQFPQGFWECSQSQALATCNFRMLSPQDEIEHSHKVPLAQEMEELA